MIVRKFYIDENVSGTNFERKAFTEMIDDIEKGKIDCVIVKDLSRLGRNEIDVGYYIQFHFPSKGVRFISISENFDTIDGITNIDSRIFTNSKIPLISMMDEQVALDTRKKVQEVIDLKIKSGQPICAKAPFGYKKPVNSLSALEIDFEASEIVRKIFGLAQEKVGLAKIVRILNAEKVPTPIDYAIKNGLKGNYKRGNGFWNSRSVKAILTNSTYAVNSIFQGEIKRTAFKRFKFPNLFA